MQLPYSNLSLSHQNPGAEMPLILPIQVVCNTSDEALYENIRINSRRPGKWLEAQEAHDGIAVLCGSGPSLADMLDNIRIWREAGAKIFAMNGAAKFLNDNGILADYQVIIDAREETAQLVGPAKEHLFGSQVHPACWDKAPDARVWHLQIENIEDHFPDYQDGYCLIGGAASVGNTATCLAYAMGYRNLQIYGYDSSHRNDKGHAFDQPMNAGDPCCFVKFGGKDYLASLTMKLQAEKFQDTARELISIGCSISVHGSGLLPDMFNATPISEEEKYQLMWGNPEYRIMSPGENVASTFVRLCRPTGKVIDFGCGTGRGSLAIAKEAICDLLLVDFTTNSRDPEAIDLPFLCADISKPMDIRGDYGFCADVMEHIPPELVEKTIKNIMEVTPCTFFQISLVPDNLGGLIGHPLHLSVHSFEWWSDLFARLGFCVLWHRDQGDSALFYISST